MVSPATQPNPLPCCFVVFVLCASAAVGLAVLVWWLRSLRVKADMRAKLQAWNEQQNRWRGPPPPISF